ncbi:MAG: hypothetical protein GC165_05550, partial [Armatimonadetes bacterium]|nr:hypothetical protein [Armatimonadota bacterium]
MPHLNWLHLTDWHQGRTDFNRSVVRDALMDDIRKRQEIHPDLAKIDFLFFTGDLAFKGAKDEYVAAVEEFLNPVTEALGIDKSRVVTIPGNHDIDRSQIPFLADVLQHRFKDLSEQSKVLGNKVLLKQLPLPFDAYEEFAEAFGHVGFGAFGGYQTYSIDKALIGVFGCNSALMCGREKKTWPDGAVDVDDLGNLTVSEEQLRPLLRPLDDCHFVFGLVHHPFSWLTEFEKGPIQKLFRDNSTVVLMGHEHEQVVSASDGERVNHLLINGGATYDRRIASHPINANTYTFGSYELAKGKCRIFVRRLNYGGDKFTKPEDGGTRTFTLKSKCQDLYKALKPVGKPMSKSGVVDLDAVRKTYLESIVGRYRNLDQRGILQGDQKKSIELDAVYISLSANQNRNTDVQERYKALLDRSQYLMEVGKYDAVPIEGAAEVDEELGKLSGLVGKESPNKSINLAELIRDGHRTVILGDPGAGKTTLARFVTRHYAQSLSAGAERVIVEEAFRCDEKDGFVQESVSYDYGKTRLPILVRVSEFSEALKKDSTQSLSSFLTVGVGDCQASEAELRSLFEDAIGKGGAFVILDGLDEVTDDGIRSTVSTRIDEFVSGGGKLCPILVTSREAGFEKARPTTSFEVCKILDMDSEQIRQFITRRIMVFEKSQSGIYDPGRLYGAAKDEIDKILEAIETNEGVRRLSVNPLLLTILCLIHRNNKALPQRRVELYKVASEILLTFWRVAQTGNSASAISLDEADIYLAPLAEWMHEHLSNGLIHRDKAREILFEISAARHRKSQDDPDVLRDVDTIWRKLTYDTSVFVDRGDDHYAFLHLTFEEYWAARQLVRDSSKMAELVRWHRKDPRFREVIRLAVASRSEADAAQLIRSAIWCPTEKAEEFGYVPSRLEAELNRDFELACECVSDCTSIAPDLADEIAKQAVSVWGASPDHDFVANLVQLLRSTMAGEAIATELLKQKPNASAIGALGQLGSASTSVVDALIQRLGDENPTVRYVAAQSLGRLGSASASVVDALIQRLGDENPTVRYVAAQSLGRLGSASASVVDALIQRLGD